MPKAAAVSIVSGLVLLTIAGWSYLGPIPAAATPPPIPTLIPERGSENPTATPVPTDFPPTLVPETDIPPTPASAVIEGFVPAHPYLFTSQGKTIDFEIPQRIDLDFVFAGDTNYGFSVMYDGDPKNIGNQLGSCAGGERHIVVMNAFDGDTSVPAWYKTALVAHSGSCKSTGEIHPFEGPRGWFEGGWGFPSAKQRENRMAQFWGKDSSIGAGLTKEQRVVGFNGVYFQIVDMAFVPKAVKDLAFSEDIKKLGFARTTYLDRFFSHTDQSPLTHEIFLFFCGSSGTAFDWFADTYVLRLVPINASP